MAAQGAAPAGTPAGFRLGYCRPDGRPDGVGGRHRRRRPPYRLALRRTHPLSARFTARFTAAPADIDELGHVNNAVWVRWIQAIAVAHWEAVAPADQRAAYVWVVTRHEIDYRGNVSAGETVTAETWVPEPPKGARFDRHVRFRDAAGRVTVAAVTTWAMIDRATGRLARVRADIAAPFLA